MKNKIRIFGHPVHPMLVHFPIVLYTITLICYILYYFLGDLFYFKVALYANIAGVVMAAIAALPGFIDWLSLPQRTGAKRTGVRHMLLNVAALICFAIAAVIQYGNINESTPSVGSAIALAAIGFVLTIFAAYLGYELIQKHHVGLDETSVVSTHKPD